MEDINRPSSRLAKAIHVALFTLEMNLFPKRGTEYVTTCIRIDRTAKKAWILPKHAKLCSGHFCHDDFTPLKHDKRRMLKKCTVSTVFFFMEKKQCQESGMTNNSSFSYFMSRLFHIIKLEIFSFPRDCKTKVIYKVFLLYLIVIRVLIHV